MLEKLTIVSASLGHSRENLMWFSKKENKPIEEELDMMKSVNCIVQVI